MTKSKKYKTQQKSLKTKDNPKIFKEYSPFLHSEKKQHKGLLNTIINDVKCDIIIEGKSYTFKNPETKFKINEDLSCNSKKKKKKKNVVYIIECNECKEIYIGSTQALSLHRSNINIEN